MRNVRLFQLLCSVSLVGCVPLEDLETATASHELAGHGTLWPNGVVRVCWETGSADDGSGNATDPRTRADWSTLSRVVRDTTRSTWGRVANLEFTGFAACPSNSATGNAGYLAINLANNGNASGANTTVGYQASTWTRMRLDPEQAGGAGSETFRGQVMHEVGHALGFFHEWDRADNPRDTGCIVADANFENKTTTYYGTQFDIHSIMNFSYDQGEPHCQLPKPFRLSAWDIVGVQNAYGRRRPGTLVAASGSCLDLPTPYASSAGLQVWQCHNGSNQVWRAASNGTIAAQSYSAFVTAPASGAQLVATAQSVPLAQDQIWRGSPNGYQLRGIGETCLDVPNSVIANGKPVQIYSCHGGSNQRWRAYADGTVRPSANTSYCLDVPNGAATAGNLLQLFACHGGASQRFTFTNAGEIKFGALCLDVVGGRPSSGSRIQLNSCKAAGDLSRVNQLWHLTMAIAGSNGQCVQAQGSTANNGNDVVQTACNAAIAGQSWDFYFNSFTGF